MPDGNAYDQAYYAMSRPEAGRKSLVDTLRDRYIRRHVLRFRQTGRLLDIGCGLGLFLQSMTPPFEPFGTDISAYAVAQAQQRLPNAKLFVGSILDGIPFSVNFDVITAINVVEHLEQPALAVAAIRERLQLGGLFVAHLPTIGNRLQARIYRGSYDADPTHIYRPSGREFRGVAEAAGFKTVFETYSPFAPALLWRNLPWHPAYLAIFQAR
ncbi:MULTISPECIES: class I SAM-dependent methyltransferase [Herpetosiphon]|uniref:class I SAM-dependent methyltransferase n=1 Tax=Herpetosiphon TaxID=64 RepID=UPI00195E167B|nr:class I SAM-dependent methyltransferase [Herpetosiphon giganteus]MBM7844080.1 SAM-dependent methyltransferase [Herpetosiphon giganteus]